ncbi:MAG: FixH family protein [Gammaproteobacteria bacterium]|nr:FixH family protein [Gammaproteobacteria bacterium]
MSTTAMNKKSFSQDNPNPWRNPWVIGWLALVAIVLLVNIVMISLAFITNPGLVSEDYYERGQEHEQNVRSRIAARETLGWTVSTDFPQNPVQNRKELYRFNIVDKAGNPLTGADVSLNAYRPSDAEADFNVKMTETLTGLYEARITYPLKGIWELNISINRDNDAYDFTRRSSVITE